MGVASPHTIAIHRREPQAARPLPELAAVTGLRLLQSFAIATRNRPTTTILAGHKVRRRDLGP